MHYLRCLVLATDLPLFNQVESEASAARTSALAAGLTSRDRDHSDQPPAIRLLVAKHRVMAALSTGKVRP